MEGQRFKHFSIESLIGRGGMGEVYLATDTTLERRVALKFLPRTLTGDPAAQGRLLDEARSCSRVQHPNIAVIHSIEEDGGMFAIVMEYVEGQNLREIIRRQQLSLSRVARIGRAVAAGLQAAHDQGIVHRDLKPANVMLTRRGEVKIMDFGLALRPERIVNTMGTTAYGTVGYMSPEQARGEKATPASDIFSYGTLLYELLTREPPFKRENDLATLQAIVKEEPIPLRDLRRDTPPAMEGIVRRCMRKDVGERFGSMTEVADELQYVEPVVDAGPKDLILELANELTSPDQEPSHGSGPQFRSGPGPIPRSRGEEPGDGLPPMAPLLNVSMEPTGSARRDPLAPASTGASPPGSATATAERPEFDPARSAAIQLQRELAPRMSRQTRDIFVGPESRVSRAVPRPPAAAPDRGRGLLRNALGLLLGLLLAALGFLGLLRAAGVSTWNPPLPGLQQGNLTPGATPPVVEEPAPAPRRATPAAKPKSTPPPSEPVEDAPPPSPLPAPLEAPDPGPSATGGDQGQQLGEDHGGGPPEQSVVEPPGRDPDRLP